ncbi:MAG: hypothetical protein MK212_18460 [Saprospiraceae bacterium]|nr:hypothetical protein [Saprospiraceae bacterium]
MKWRTHSYFITLNHLIFGTGIFVLDWHLAYVLHFLFVWLQLNILFYPIRYLFNAETVTLPRRDIFRRIPGMFGNWILVFLTLIPSLLMVSIIAMAYLDEELRKYSYSLTIYFQYTFSKLFAATLYPCLALLGSFIIEHVIYVVRGQYKYFLLKRYRRSLYAVYLIIFPIFIIGVLVLHDIEIGRNIDVKGLLFPALIFVVNLLADLILLRLGYRPSNESKKVKKAIQEEETPVVSSQE